MQLNVLDSEKMETLEDYAVFLGCGIISTNSIEKFHATAIEKGILTDDMIMRAKVLIWDCHRQRKQIYEQLQEVLALLPDNFNLKDAFKNRGFENGM